MLLNRVYYICGHMSKIHLYSPIIYYIALFHTLKKIYTVKGHEMYCSCVFFYLCVTHILTRTVTELPTVKGFMFICLRKNVMYFTLFFLLYSI